MNKGRLVGAVVALALMAGTSGCTAASSASGAQQSTGKPVLTIGMQETGANLNPAVNVGGAPMYSLSYAAITHLNPDGTVAPGLATSWHYIGTGNLNFQFTLREGARFSDGTPVTADAVKTYLNYFAQAKGPFASDIVLKSITTVGKWTVILHLGTPNPDLPFLLSEVVNVGYVSSPRAEAHPSVLSTQTDGAGPYQAVPSQTIAGSQYVFVPNKYYFDPSAIRFSKVIVKIITQSSTMLEAMRTGQVNVGQGDITTASAAKAAGLNVISSTYGWDGILFLDRGMALPNGKTPDPLASVQVRQALNYAVDRNAITKGILGKYGIPTSEAPTVDGFDPAYQNYYPYNPAKAKALLAVAGYPAGFTINVADQTFFGTLGDPVLEAMAKYLSAVGVRLNITQSSSLDQWLPNFENGTYSATGFTQEPFVPMYQFYHFYLSPGGIANQHGWHDPVLDKLWQQGAAATPKASSAYWQEMSRRVVTQADEVPVFEDNTFWYTAKDIGGVAFSSANSAPLPTEWYIK